MDDQWKERVRARLAVLGLGMKEASLKTGRGETYVRDILERHRSPSIDGFSALASTLGMTVSQLLGEADGELPRPLVPIMGYIGAGQEIQPEFEQVPVDGLDEVEVTFPVPPDMIGFEIRGDSMLPRYDEGDVVICYRQQRREIETFFGEEAAVLTEEGRRFLKKIEAGSKPRTVNLESWNARPMKAVKLKWIGEVYLTVRSGQIRRLNAREKAARQRRERARAAETAGMGELPLKEHG